MTDIFYKTYYPDFEWINYSLLSLSKFVTGYNKVVILVPRRFFPVFHAHLPERSVIIQVEDEGEGYLRQQAYKMNAHKYCEADYILYADSDCLFTHPVDVGITGKPRLLYTSWDKVGAAICWKECTEKFIGKEVPYEFMRQNLTTYLRSTLVEIEKQYPNLEERIMANGRFSEFNFIGAWAWFNDPNYNFVNTDTLNEFNPLGKQFWSRGGITKEIKEEINKILYDTTTNLR